MAGKRARRQVFKRDLARHLRANPTDAERRLWFILRRRQLQLRFRRQQPIGPYVADFFCPAAKLIVELDGDQHGSDAGMAKDAIRTHWLKQQGFIVLRFPNDLVLKDDALVTEAISRAVTAAPVPLPEAPAALRPSLKGRVE
jgi:very-short-patch-repair endonuclease